MSGIYKAYDIRGIHGAEMDEDDAREIGRAFVEVLAGLQGKEPGNLSVGLGRDMRLSAPAMASALREGMVEQGATVLDAGMVATEMLYFLVGSRDLDGGAMVTASHNPAAYTGVKLVREGALALSGDAGIGEIESLVAAGIPDGAGPGSVEGVEIAPEFRQRALSLVDPGAIGPLKVVVDGGNGMAGPM
ncbi:MAG: phosphomannomutase/phosphoglucomutase, partial [Solirubrobacterales bacterium]